GLHRSNLARPIRSPVPDLTQDARLHTSGRFNFPGAGQRGTMRGGPGRIFGGGSSGPHGHITEERTMNVYVGTSGYSYPEWKGSFYPAKMPAREMLGFYATRFRTVEINNT